MRRLTPISVLIAALLGCAPPAPQSGEESIAAPASLPSGRWLAADGAGESALVFVPDDGGKEIALICSMGTEPTFRVETGDEAFAAVPEAAAGAILVGDVAIEGALSRMATETGDLVQMRTAISETLLTHIRAAQSFRLNAGDAFVVTGPVPTTERDGFAARCASIAGVAGP